MGVYEGVEGHSSRGTLSCRYCGACFACSSATSDALGRSSTASVSAATATASRPTAADLRGFALLIPPLLPPRPGCRKEKLQMSAIHLGNGS